MLPSERLGASARVSPFPFEPLVRYVEEHAWVSDVLRFGSDFPHEEGGMDSNWLYEDRLRPLGDEIASKLLAGNAELLLPV
jgi:predicted TIM-barrel fold metal-dependent hydrolase